MDDAGFEFRQGPEIGLFSTTSRLVPVFTQPLMQWVPELFFGLTAAGA